ncbi:hypothetical protein EVAR_5503_1 [Eumeta japonica]|uniref:Uncharacterized protein n=1 Tax=Eumeta variegata TaxID=151549 RepID=A0A4C1TBH8_EUMVA|nr:hypothetical protein EVAR_5503_1 [Eumeta japonica]
MGTLLWRLRREDGPGAGGEERRPRPAEYAERYRRRAAALTGAHFRLGLWIVLKCYMASPRAGGKMVLTTDVPAITGYAASVSALLAAFSRGSHHINTGGMPPSVVSTAPQITIPLPGLLSRFRSRSHSWAPHRPRSLIGFRDTLDLIPVKLYLRNAYSYTENARAAVTPLY